MTSEEFDVVLLRHKEGTFETVRLGAGLASRMPVWVGDSLSAFPAGDYSLFIAEVSDGEFTKALDLPGDRARIELIISGDASEGYVADFVPDSADISLR